MSESEYTPPRTPGQGSSLRFRLRAATAGAHEQLDAVGAQFDLATPRGYAAFLSAHAALLPGIEAQLTRQPLPPDWPSRCRASTLAVDLSSLGAGLPAAAAIPHLETAAMRVGALYVLEGSRLGGAVLLQRLRAMQPGVSCAFLSHGVGQSLWPRFVVWLDGLELDGTEREAAVEGARRTFDAFDLAFRCWAV